MFIETRAVIARFFLLHVEETMTTYFAHDFTLLDSTFIATFDSLVTRDALTDRMVKEVGAVVLTGAAHVGARCD